MAGLATLGPGELAQVVARYREVLRAHQEELNRLNVYPVPDGDTGTNLTLTLESVVRELDGARTMPEVCAAIAKGSLMGARGNSGVIMSQVLRGLTEVFRDHEQLGPEELAAGLRRAADAAYEAVMRPVEGTILTVVRETAEAAEAAVGAAAPGNRAAGAADPDRGGSPSPDGAADLVALVDRCTAAAHDAVRRTPELLPVLARAGVVDAGGRGFSLFVDTLASVVDGRPVPAPEVVATPAVVATGRDEHDVGALRYEVMFLLEADDATIPAFREAWAALGDSIVVVGGDGLWNCHVHTDDIGGAIEAGVEAGRPRNIRVTDLREEVEEEAWVRRAASAAATPGDGEPEAVSSDRRCATAVVAVAVGDGVQRLLRSLGVHEVVAGGQTMNPSTAEILAAVERCPADAVVILPNNSNIIPVARQVAGITAKQVEVVPTTSVVQALAALVSYDPDAGLEENVEALTEAARAVRTGEVTQAVRDAVAECGEIREGQWMAIGPDGVLAAAAEPLEAALTLVDALVGDGADIVTVLAGRDAPAAEVARLRERIEVEHPEVEVEVHDGGQPLYPYLIGVE
jgi:DAK2 domain fusion protein YloV